MKRFKWLLIVLACVLAIPAAQGSALVTKGSNELAVSGELDFQSGVGMEFLLDFRYGYFVIDRLSVGPRITLENNDFLDQYSIGVFSEYNFKLPADYKPLFGTDLVPYLGVFVDYRSAHFENLGTEIAGVLGGEAGLKFFLTDTMAVTLSLIGEVATDDVYADDEQAASKDLGMRLGMRFYF